MSPASRTSRGERVAVLAVAIAPEVDARENDLPMSLLHALSNLGQDSIRRAAPGGTTHLRNDAEPAREAAAVLDLDEGSDAIEADRSVRAPQHADVRGHLLGCLLAGSRDNPDVVGKAGELATGQVRRAPGQVDLPGAARRAPDGLPRLSHRLMRDTARVHDRDVGLAGGLAVPSAASRSRSAWASVCDTLQPRNSTEKVAIAGAILAAVWGR